MPEIKWKVSAKLNDDNNFINFSTNKSFFLTIFPGQFNILVISMI
jgi:hypothetical protein